MYSPLYSNLVAISSATSCTRNRRTLQFLKPFRPSQSSSLAWRDGFLPSDTRACREFSQPTLMHVRGSVCHLAIRKSQCARLVSGPSTWGTYGSMIARMPRLTEFPPSHPPISSDGMSEARHRRIKPGDFIKLLRIFFFSSQRSRRCPQAQLCKSRGCGHVILPLNSMDSKVIVLLESRLAPMPDSESDDEFPNDFDGIDFSAVPELQPQHLQLPQAGPSTTTISSQVDLTGTPTSDQGTGVSVNISDPRGTSSSLDSFDELDVDPYLLAACDEIEHRALWGHHTNTVPGPLANVSPPGSFGKGKKRSFTDCDFHSQPVAKPSVVATLNAPESYSGEKLQTILGGYEDEITCPICCDILVAAFMCNPCGHTTCGDCGYGWIARNRYSPTCAVCRSELIKSKPLLPNYAIDNVVKHHVSALAESGRTEWQERGYKFIDWKKRLDAWKKQYPGILAEENDRETRRRRHMDHPPYPDAYYESLRLALENYNSTPLPPTSNRRSRRRDRRHP